MFDFLKLSLRQLICLRQSPRFDVCNVESLVKYAPDIHSLTLAQIGKMADPWLPLIGQFRQLTHLDLSRPNRSLTSEAVIELLSHVGSGLVSLRLDENYSLLDSVLTDGILSFCHRLTNLSIFNLIELDPEGMVKLSDERQTAFEELNIGRCFAYTDDVLAALIRRSQATLERLSLHSLHLLTAPALASLSSCPKLKELDLSFCRALDDHALGAILVGCPDLRRVITFGCNRLTKQCPQRVSLLFGFRK